METTKPLDYTIVIDLLKRYGVRQQDIADAFHLDKRTVSHWFRYRRAIPRAYQPDLWALAALARTYGRDAIERWRPFVRALKREGGIPDPETWVIAPPLDALPPDAFTGDLDTCCRTMLHHLAAYSASDPAPGGFALDTLETLRHLAQGLLMLVWELQTTAAVRGTEWERA